LATEEEAQRRRSSGGDARRGAPWCGCRSAHAPRSHSCASSKSEYATGVAISVSASTSVWPPMMTNPIARLVPDPRDDEWKHSGDEGNVVMRMGRKRSRLA
jgi:hypothetical protein